MSALLSALSVTEGRFSLTLSRPVRVMFRQKSTWSVCSDPPYRVTASSVRSVIRTQFSSLSVLRFGQFLRRSKMQSSVMWPHPDSVRDSRFGHLLQTSSKKSLTVFSCLLQKSFWKWFFIQSSMLHTLTLSEYQQMDKYFKAGPRRKLFFFSSAGE